MPRKKQDPFDELFLRAHGIRVSPDTFLEMVVDQMVRLRQILDQPSKADLTETEIEAVWRSYSTD